MLKLVSVKTTDQMEKFLDFVSSVYVDWGFETPESADENIRGCPFNWEETTLSTLIIDEDGQPVGAVRLVGGEEFPFEAEIKNLDGGGKIDPPSDLIRAYRYGGGEVSRFCGERSCPHLIASIMLMMDELQTSFFWSFCDKILVRLLRRYSVRWDTFSPEVRFHERDRVIAGGVAQKIFNEIISEQPGIKKIYERGFE